MTGRVCSICKKVITGQRSQWESHARTHTFLREGVRRWRTVKPYWRWQYELLNPAEPGPKLWVERTEAARGVPPKYIAKRRSRPRGRVESVVLAVSDAKAAKAEAAKLLDLDWGPIILSQQDVSAA